jgi:hypothetical protein
MFYTGVGSRKTPNNVLALMNRIAIKMSYIGYTLRSGGAEGADTAFELGASIKEIYYAKDCTPEAMTIAAQFHPAWHKCSEFARKLHGRNAFQVLGRQLNDPSQYCICWTPDGATTHRERVYRTGGTGTAISIADHYKVPVINLAIPSEFQKWDQWSMAA